MASFCFARDRTQMCDLGACGGLNHCSEFFMSSLYLNSTSPPFVLWLWSTSTIAGGIFFPAPLMIGLSTWLTLIKGIGAEVTSSHFQAEASKDVAYSACISCIPEICQEWSFLEESSLACHYRHLWSRSEPHSQPGTDLPTDCEKSKWCLPVNLGWFVIQHYSSNSWLIQGLLWTFIFLPLKWGH